jgi:hypothetical protein
MGMLEKLFVVLFGTEDFEVIESVSRIAIPPGLEAQHETDEQEKLGHAFIVGFPSWRRQLTQ